MRAEFAARLAWPVLALYQLDLGPQAPEHVLTRVDELLGSRDRALVERVGGHWRILPRPFSPFKRQPAGARSAVRQVSARR
jgi:hypothetical protein